MKKTKEMKGITLVALVITVIILLILATISIQTLTNTGLFGKAKEATKKYSEAEEKEKIQMELYYAQINKSTNGTSTNQIGEQLYDKNVENGSKWHIIVINDSKKIYGTGWTYIPRGSTISDTKTNETWLINNSSQEIIKLEDGTFTDLSYKTAVGTTDGLIFNLDPSVIENATKENINEKLGSNVELMNFDWNKDSGLTKKSFNFDGVNDYIKIKYDKEEEKNTLTDNGFTFEFYGTYNGGTSYNLDNKIVDNSYKGLFCYWDGNEKTQAKLRFGIYNQKNIVWNPGSLGVKFKETSDYSDKNGPWNIVYPENEKIQNTPFTFALKYDKMVGRIPVFRPRKTGDMLTLPDGRCVTLKKLFLDRRLPQPVRDRVPVLELDGQVIAVAGFGADPRWTARDGEQAVILRIEKEEM